MNKDDILDLAREAGVPVHAGVLESALGKFAVLVAAAEREACERVCQQIAHSDGNAYDVWRAIATRGKRD